VVGSGGIVVVVVGSGGIVVVVGGSVLGVVELVLVVGIVGVVPALVDVVIGGWVVVGP
jgi:hypothetical protein